MRFTAQYKKFLRREKNEQEIALWESKLKTVIENLEWFGLPFAKIDQGYLFRLMPEAREKLVDEMGEEEVQSIEANVFEDKEPFEPLIKIPRTWISESFSLR